MQSHPPHDKGKSRTVCTKKSVRIDRRLLPTHRNTMRSLQAVPVAVLLLIFAVAVALPAGTGAVWVPIPAGDLNRQLVKQVAGFAVLVHDLSRHANLGLVKVESGEIEQPGAGGIGIGTSYRLVLTAETSPGGSRWLYRCEVWGVPGSVSAAWRLRSFKPI